MTVSTSTSALTNWASLPLELQQHILEYLSYFDLKIIQQVSKDMQALSTSTPRLRSLLFRTEKVDLVAVYKLVGLPQWAEATAAKLEARQRAQDAGDVSDDTDDEDDWYDSDNDDKYCVDDDGGDRHMSCFNSVKEAEIRLHPSLRSVSVVREPSGQSSELSEETFYADLSIEWSLAVQENATEPPLGRATVVITDLCDERGRLRRIGRPMHRGAEPLTVEDVLDALRRCLKGYDKTVWLTDRCKGSTGTFALAASTAGEFEMSLEYDFDSGMAWTWSA